METRSSPCIEVLHRLAKNATIDGFERIPKCQLYALLKTNVNNFDEIITKEVSTSVGIIENSFKKRKRTEIVPTNTTNSSNKRKFKSVLNKLDPIMLCPVGKKNIFKLKRQNGSVIAFNIESLVNYLLASGDFSDPETRILFSDNELKEIDCVAKKAGLAKGSVFDAKHNIHMYNDLKFRRDALLGLERCAGEVIADILQSIETMDPDEAQMQLAMKDFPVFLDYFRQIRDADHEYAAKCISHWKSFMEGPPNKPYKDEHGLIYVVCHFLKTCNDGTS